jgi:hypothetical protein
MRRWSVAPILFLAMLTGACDRLPSLPMNPFAAAATPTVVTVAPPPAPPSPTPVPTATLVPFTPFWVKNHRQAEMWSGQADQPGVISFGTTSAQFCSFQVLAPPDGPRLYVLNPYSGGTFWIDADAVGPVSEPPARAPGPKPEGQNCAEQIYDG